MRKESALISSRFRTIVFGAVFGMSLVQTFQAIRCAASDTGIKNEKIESLDRRLYYNALSLAHYFHGMGPVVMNLSFMVNSEVWFYSVWNVVFFINFAFCTVTMATSASDEFSTEYAFYAAFAVQGLLATLFDGAGKIEYAYHSGFLRTELGLNEKLSKVLGSLMLIALLLELYYSQFYLFQPESYVPHPLVYLSEALHLSGLPTSILAVAVATIIGAKRELQLQVLCFSIWFACVVLPYRKSKWDNQSDLSFPSLLVTVVLLVVQLIRILQVKESKDDVTSSAPDVEFYRSTNSTKSTNFVEYHSLMSCFCFLFYLEGFMYIASSSGDLSFIIEGMIISGHASGIFVIIQLSDEVEAISSFLLSFGFLLLSVVQLPGLFKWNWAFLACLLRAILALFASFFAARYYFRANEPEAYQPVNTARMSKELQLPNKQPKDMATEEENLPDPPVKSLIWCQRLILYIGLVFILGEVGLYSSFQEEELPSYIKVVGLHFSILLPLALLFSAGQGQFGLLAVGAMSVGILSVMAAAKLKSNFVFSLCLGLSTFLHFALTGVSLHARNCSTSSVGKL